MCGFKGLSEVSGHWPGAAVQERSCPSALVWVCLNVIWVFYRVGEGLGLREREVRGAVC